jgi:hypothetical protein
MDARPRATRRHTSSPGTRAIAIGARRATETRDASFERLARARERASDRARDRDVATGEFR